MRSVLIGIQPKWCELIANGKKTVEVRKTKPKLETPFRCYIYCTKGKFEPAEHLKNNLHYDDSTIKVCEGQGKVIGEFMCDKMLVSFLNNNDGWFVEKGCLTQKEIDEYQGDKAILYGWHISDLVIYDKPKELSELRSYNVRCAFDPDCFGFPVPTHKITRPPQSWCYVEEGGAK